METKNELTYTKIIGYVGDKKITAFIYPKSDCGLNHYILNGRTFVGSVEFTSITRKKNIPYK